MPFHHVILEASYLGFKLAGVGPVLRLRVAIDTNTYICFYGFSVGTAVCEAS